MKGESGYGSILKFETATGTKMRHLALQFVRTARIAVLFVIASTSAAAIEGSATAYPSMAPLDEYMMGDSTSEIALARSAAPDAISAKATIQLLSRSGYVTASEGTNGFVCIVERSWMSPFSSPEFWNPKMRGPDCYNREAAKSVLPFVYRRTVLALRGLSKDEIERAITVAISNHEFPRLADGAMSYMMSRQQYLGDQAHHWAPHLMIFGPPTSDWGTEAQGSPVILSPQFRGLPEPINVFLIPLAKWSDGTNRSEG